MRRFRWIAAFGLLGAAVGTRVAAAQASPSDHGSIIIVTGTLGSHPVPTQLTARWHQDVADLLFLRLARLGPTLSTAGDQGFIPQLARSWQRRDSLTLVFDLDPRARWQDGVPVTARDVVFTIERTREPGVDPQRALLLRRIRSVSAEGDGRVVFRFTQAYPEQLYDATFHVQPLPAHLVDTIPAQAFAASAFVQAPVGDGPYRWVTYLPGQRIVLEANPDFFLGRPKLDRVVFLQAADPDAQLNLLLSGEADALESVPLGSLARVAGNPDLRIVRVPSFTVGYFLFNQLDRKDRTRPHPVLGDPVVRRALVLALDRQTMVRATFGDYAEVPAGPVPSLSWIRDPAARPLPFDSAKARALLDSRGWRDHDGDGMLDRDGVPLALDLNYPATSAVRVQLALQAQEQYRRIGVRLNLVALDGPAWLERRNRHDFDIDASSAGLDPSPSGLAQSWSCEGRDGSNVGGFCDPAVDSLLVRATLARTAQAAIWRRAIAQLEDDAPAAFLYAATYAFAVHRRYGNVNIRPEGWWSALAEWSVTPGRQLPRDGKP